MATRVLYKISHEDNTWQVKSSRGVSADGTGWADWKPIKHPVFKNFLDARNWVIDTKLAGNVARAQLAITA